MRDRVYLKRRFDCRIKRFGRPQQLFYNYAKRYLEWKPEGYHLFIVTLLHKKDNHFPWEAVVFFAFHFLNRTIRNSEKNIEKCENIIYFVRKYYSIDHVCEKVMEINMYY